jgi:hypothetical protein
MPDNARKNRSPFAKHASDPEETKHSSQPEAGVPVPAQDRRIRSRRSKEPANSVDDAMDVALGEDEAWDRRRDERRKAAA